MLESGLILIVDQMYQVKTHFGLLCKQDKVCFIMIYVAAKYRVVGGLKNQSFSVFSEKKNPSLFVFSEMKNCTTHLKFLNEMKNRSFIFVFSEIKDSRLFVSSVI